MPLLREHLAPIHISCRLDKLTIKLCHGVHVVGTIDLSFSNYELSNYHKMIEGTKQKLTEMKALRLQSVFTDKSFENHAMITRLENFLERVQSIEIDVLSIGPSLSKIGLTECRIPF